MDRPAADLLTITEVAALMDVSVRSVQDLVDRGLIPVAVRVGRGRRRRQWVRRADLRAFGELYFLGKPRPTWLDELAR